jgi:UDP-N-acetylmuramate dehydrogenase
MTGGSPLLAGRTTFQVGGPAEVLIEARDERTAIDALLACAERGQRAVVLGGGSNVIVADRGVPGTVIALETRGISTSDVGDGVEITAQAGETWDDFVAAMTEKGLAGVECLSGIPGKVGATPIQNVGAYGQEVSDTIVRVRTFDRALGTITTLVPSDCKFRYRDSSFKSEWPGRHVVLAVTFRLRRGPPSVPGYKELTDALALRVAPPTVSEVRSTVITLRRKKGMVLDPADPDTRSAGSFFTNPLLSPAALDDLARRVAEKGIDRSAIPTFAGDEGRTKVSAAWLIERAGFRKGHARGKAAISTKHALAITNRGGATADEIVALARDIRDGVRKELGVKLEPEPVFLGFDANPLE